MIYGFSVIGIIHAVIVIGLFVGVLLWMLNREKHLPAPAARA